jgi:hypothetical protein
MERTAVNMARWIIACLLLLILRVGASPNWEPADLVLVAGAPGDEKYEDDFRGQIEQWAALATAGGHRLARVGCDAEVEVTDREQLRQVLADLPVDATTPLWLVLIGHGTFDGAEARFNLRGPDLTPSDLANWLEPFQRPLVVINSASASAPFLPALAGPDRVIVTATRSGFEQNATRFGQFLAAAWSEADSDLDHDGQVSLLEAAVVAWRRVAEFYRSAGRLRTEHALLEDNGDGLGTPLEWFRGVRAIREPREGAVADGLRAHQFVLVPSVAERELSPEVRLRRDALERSIHTLRQRKGSMAEEDYYAELERLLLDMARLLVTPDGGVSRASDGEHNVAP